MTTRATKTNDATLAFDYASFTRCDVDLLFAMSLLQRATWHGEWSEILLAGVDLGVCPATAATISAAQVHAQLASAWAAIAAAANHSGASPSSVSANPFDERSSRNLTNPSTT
jgi:hypothetical protein